MCLADILDGAQVEAGVQPRRVGLLGLTRPDAGDVLTSSITALDALEDWRTEPIEQALRAALIDGLGLKPRLAFGPLRVAVSGRRVSPPLFESMEILGKESTLTRLRALAARCPTSTSSSSAPGPRGSAPP